MRRRAGSGAAWWFVGPALVVIAVFFFLPVLAALIMSLTDFDIYALADVHNLRFVGLRNYGRLWKRRCSGKHSSIRCISLSSACRCRSVRRWAPRSC